MHENNQLDDESIACLIVCAACQAICDIGCQHRGVRVRSVENAAVGRELRSYRIYNAFKTMREIKVNDILVGTLQASALPEAGPAVVKFVGHTRQPVLLG